MALVKKGNGIYYIAPEYKFSIGDTVSYFRKLTNSTKLLKGFVHKDHIPKNVPTGYGGFGFIKDYKVCKTTFSWKVGSGTRNLDKRQLQTCKLLLLEKKGQIELWLKS